MPLAVAEMRPRPQASQVLPPGSTLMLFTDGLVERRYESIDDGIDRAADVLAQTMTCRWTRSPTWCFTELAPATGYDDDVAMVIYRHRRHRYDRNDATADQLALIRHRLDGLAAGRRVTKTRPPTSCWSSTRRAPTVSNTLTVDSPPAPCCSRSALRRRSARPDHRLRIVEDAGRHPS